MKNKLFCLLCFFFCLSSHAGNYYLSSTGNDLNSGKSKESAWKTLDKLASVSLEGGDTVFFERGSVWYGSLPVKSGDNEAYLVYTSYGDSGCKPAINGSIRLDSPCQWVKYRDSLWVTMFSSSLDIGNMYVDGLLPVGKKKWSLDECKEEWDFFFDPQTGKVYLCFPENPMFIFDNVYLAKNQPVIDVFDQRFVIIRDLSVVCGGGHGIHVRESDRIFIEECDIAYIGGGLCPGTQNVRYGNGIEMWGNNRNIHIEGNNIHDIYDTGVTNQNHTSEAKQEYITYINNICTNCGMYSFEIWNNGGGMSTLSNIRFEKNKSYFPGRGWGEQRPDKVGYHYNIGMSNIKSAFISIEENIFYGGNGFLLAHLQNGEKPSLFDSIRIDRNEYFIFDEQRNNALWLYCEGSQPVKTFSYDCFALYKDFMNADFNSLLKCIASKSE